MIGFIQRFVLSDEFMPHGHCFYWKPGLVGLHVLSDTLIGTAYVAISLTIYSMVRRIRLPFSPMILAFGVFIGACGLTHYMEVWTLWIPDYWLSGAVKAVTAAASVATGVYLFQVRPTIVDVTRGAQLAEERRVRLESTHSELERLYARVKELDEAKTRLFANVSHELRTPLSLVLGPVERLLAGELDEGARRDLQVVRRNARILLKHVNDLLEVARLEEKAVEPEYARIDLARLARDTAEQFEALARQRRIALSVDGPGELPADGDAGQLSRVLLNLVGNAFKFVPDGGLVRLAASAEGGRAVLAVEDDGPGVPPPLREVIFERFRQGDVDPARRRPGTGLGLAIAHDLVELHQGSIRVEERSGGGARFVVELPQFAPVGTSVGAAPAPDQAAESAARAAETVAVLEEPAGPDRPEPEPRPGAPLVLVVEDNPDMTRFVASALADEFRIETAQDGAEGLEKAEALLPDLVLADLMMPRLGGDKLIAELRRRPALAAVPAMVLTARADERVRVRMLREGAHDYLLKPFFAEELRARARNLVSMKRSRDVLERELSTRGGDLEELARELAARKRDLELALDTARVAREQAERASQVKSTFLSMISHELRTPLTSMQLSVQVLQRDETAALTERQRDALRRVANGSRRLKAMVESLLEYTRVETGRMVVRPERLDLGALAREVVDELLPQAQQKLLELSVAPHGPLPPLESDPRLLRLVLVNLVVNAVKYTERGSVRVAVGHDARGHWLEVKDTGPGIPPDERARIFEPFEQLEPIEQKHSAGVGLGLSLVRGVVRALGGSIEVSSEAGQGATFVVRLPAAVPAVPAASA